MNADTHLSTTTPDDLAPLLARLPKPGCSSDDILEAFLDAVLDRDIELYGAQEEAILEIMAGKHVLLSTPTGSGKTLVAEALLFKCLAERKRAFYTSPIKALASEKFFDFCARFGANNVGMMTGDAAINRDAPIICCTAEILSNLALREGASLACDAAVLDEFHYYSDRDRGVAWQLPLLALPQTTFLLMSATLGDCLEIRRGLETLTGKPLAEVRSHERPVPLDFSYRETPIHETIETLVAEHKYPIYVVNFTQRDCAEQAQNLMSSHLCSKEEKQQIGEALAHFRFDTSYGREMQRFVRHGVGIHHAGLLPKYRRLVEQLAQQGLLKVINGTDTLGVGVNIPIRTVLFTRLCKFDGDKVGILSVRDFKQISGRAGRKGFDDQGSVVCQAPEWVIDNRKLEEKAVKGGKKISKIVKKKPPERNFVNWEESTFQRLIAQAPEAMQSRFEVSHGMLLHLLQGGVDNGSNGYRTLIDIIARCHETDKAKSKHRRRAAVLMRALRKANIITMIKNPQLGNRFFIDAELQRDFSLNHSLSLYLLETMPKLDLQLETYALDVLSLVEAILESPQVIIKRQIDKLFVMRLGELKAQGMEYDERMAELEKLEHPKPNREFIYDTFNSFAARHPWVGTENIRPKSIAREIYERYCTFGEYIVDYGLQRSEGLLLRYLSDAYKTLVQNVPENMKDERVYELLAFMRTMLREIDASLITEWEQLLEPSAATLAEGQREKIQQRRQNLFDPETNPRAFSARVRAELHRLVQALSRRDYEAATLCVHPRDDNPWDANRFEQTLKDFYQEHEALLFDHRSRLSEFTIVEQQAPRCYRARQILLDSDEHNDWAIEVLINIDENMDAELPMIVLQNIAV